MLPPSRVLESFADWVHLEWPALLEEKDPGTPVDAALARQTLDKWFAGQKATVDRIPVPDNGFKAETTPMVKALYSAGEGCKAALITLVGNIWLDTVRGSKTPTQKAEIIKSVQTLIPDLTEADWFYATDAQRQTVKAAMVKRFEAIQEISEADARKRLEKWIADMAQWEAKVAGEQAKKALLGKSATMERYLNSWTWNNLVWNYLMTEEEKKILEADVQRQATQLGWTEKSWQKRVLGSEQFGGIFGVKFLPVSVEKAEQLVQIQAPPPVVTSMLEPSQTSKVFRVNRTGAGGAADYEEGTLSDLMDNLGAVFQRVLTGKISEIRSVSIGTSCDRYRNTGDAEALTWGQLAYTRSVSLGNLVMAMARESGYSDAQIEGLQKLIKIDFKGENGDGTSGPNPLAPKGFGYYTKAGKWVNLADQKGANREDIQVIPIDAEGTATSNEPKTETRKAQFSEMKDANSYDKFRYSKVVIEYVVVKDTKEKPVENILTDSKLSYPARLNMPERYEGGDISIPIPKIFTSWTIGKKGGNGCPGSGQEVVNTTFGVKIEPVKVGKWKREIKYR